MRKAKRHIVNSVYVIIVTFMVSFFGCDGDDYFLRIENQTRDILSIHINGCINRIYKFVESDTEIDVYFATDVSSPKTTNASKYIDSISIFTLDDVPFLYLSGEEIDKKVIFTGRISDTSYFRFEVKEEYFGIGLD